MKISLRSILPFLVGGLSLALLAFSGGPAASGARGYTGAPSSGGGTEGTCSICHGGGTFGEPRLALRFDGSTPTAYRPGQTYRVTVAVRPGTGTANGYGFQAQFLNSASTTAGTLGEAADFTQISTLSDGRVYAEHQAVNQDSLFSFDWTAPEAGTGEVSVYLVGNTVNDNGGTSGDNGSTAPLLLTLSEDATTATADAGRTPEAVRAFPNPFYGTTRIQLPAEVTGWVDTQLYGADGRLLERATRAAGSLTAELTGRPAGTYRLVITDDSGRRYVSSLVKR
ncbi:choice-of-anchor V domain-containing protein [Lewinella sp. IMCC34183]|uniref:choice-of-anchor V domain-containing protein n=1 Tax=Lewinella sp. IMCC34183 TaxID=2248762 RepID=UPI000E23AE4D|nr:choice-of-anchor V domain-containing protein [Lewinella sp. IMCC34183]